MSKRYNPYPKRRNARGRAEMRRQRLLYRLCVAQREFFDFLSRQRFVPPNMTPYESSVPFDKQVRMIREGGEMLTDRGGTEENTPVGGSRA